jgi:hypothetical protein
VKQGLFFNGINMSGNDFAVNQIFQKSGSVLPNIADTACAVSDETSVAANIASDGFSV